MEPVKNRKSSHIAGNQLTELNLNKSSCQYEEEPSTVENSIRPAQLESGLKRNRKKVTEDFVSKAEALPCSTLFHLYEGARFSSHDDAKGLDLTVLQENMTANVERVKAGDLTGIEQLLVQQIDALNHFFYRYLEFGLRQEEIEHTCAIFHLALRMQEQARKTAATLAAVKNPKQTAFIKQLNQGVTQQINNPVSSENFTASQANEIYKEPEGEKYGPLDSRVSQQTSGCYSASPAMGTSYGSQNCGGEKNFISKRF